MPFLPTGSHISKVGSQNFRNPQTSHEEEAQYHPFQFLPLPLCEMVEQSLLSPDILISLRFTLAFLISLIVIAALGVSSRPGDIGILVNLFFTIHLSISQSK
jgi:hypothetical protein